MIDIQSFKKEVYAIIGAIPRGKVVTYGQIAWLAGYPNHSRLVGHVLKNTRPELHFPCHRVVNSQGRTVPHWQEQRELLETEGVIFRGNGCVDMHLCQWDLGIPLSINLWFIPPANDDR